MPNAGCICHCSVERPSLIFAGAYDTMITIAYFAVKMARRVIDLMLLMRRSE